MACFCWQRTGQRPGSHLGNAILESEGLIRSIGEVSMKIEVIAEMSLREYKELNQRTHQPHGLSGSSSMLAAGGFPCSTAVVMRIEAIAERSHW